MDDKRGIAFCAQLFLVCLLIKSTGAITSLSVTSQPFNVNEDAADGDQIIRPANIAPVNDVGTLTYSIQGYAAATHPFLMPDTSTGRINLDLAVLTLDFEQQSEYELVLRVDDAGDNTFASATVTVLVADVNEVPEFLSLPRTVRIEEDAALGTVFNLLNAAFDQDVGQSLTYTINPASTVFAISGTNVETIAALDYETTTSYNLTIEVADDGATSLTATSTLTVSIVDVNDQSPIYAATTCDGLTGGLVNDDATVGSAITFITPCTLTATDADSGDIITYSLSGADSSYYAIDGSTPTAINVAQSLSGQGGSTHTITVTATDKAGNTGTLTVFVNVADTSDNAPVCDPSVYFASVSEDTATGTSVVTLTCTDADAGDTLTYTIISGVDGTTPELEMSTGTIEMMQTAVTLDYDTMASVNYQYDVKVEVADGTNTVTATVIIQITGINDNTPSISISPTTGTVSEDASIGTTVLAASAYTVSDADDGADGDLTYSLSVDNDGGSKFDIVASTGVVVLIDSLDAETFALYTLTITVTDGGTNPSALSNSATYTLGVTNVNDVAPTFGQTLYEDTILETAAANTVVRTLAATEGGEGDTLTYSIVSGNTNNKFAIAGTNNDEIQLATVFDLTTDPMTYLLGVQVTDGGTPELTATTTVRVDVTLVNSETPAFALVIIPSFVAENTAAGTVITTEIATDNDYGSYGTITYSYTVSPTSDMFVYDGTTGQLTLARPPDFETDDPQYEIIVTAEDGGGLTTTATLTVFITNTNDNTPYFDKGQYIAQIFESDTAGTEIVTMVTADADGDNTTTTIFTGNSLGKFQLKTGTDTTTSPVVELATAIDLSTDPSSYTLVLQVVDRDTAGLTGSATINVIVTDTNTAPTISDATFTINEDAGIGDTVGTVQATDPDSGTDGELTYTTSVSPSAGDSLFVYDTSSGGIEVIGALDYETLTQYIMTIIVQDGASASATASVTINIGDVNDVAPSFDQTLYQVSINEDEAVGTNVVTFVMTDSEGTGSITFDFVKGNGVGKFRLNSSAVEINSVINIDSPDLDDVHYTLVVKAMDGGTPELTSTATVEVEIDPVNENPDFSALTTPFISQVQESDAIGTTIATLTAVDNDYGTQGELTYALGYVTVPTTQVLTLDPDTAVLKVATALDYETQDKVYELTVTATDGGGGSAVFTATVSIMDVNDNTPVFNPATYTASINEDTAAVGDIVITGGIVATDADDAAFGTVQYSISAGNADGVFTIDQNTGLITIQSIGSLDYETTTQYALTVLGKDGATGADQRTATVTVYVDVDPANEHDPVFTAPTSSPFAVTIAESAALGSTLYTVVATDQDSGSDGEIKYSITSGDLGKFNIDETSGVVYVADTLDREILGTYTLAIRASDQGTTARTADVTLAVTVDDVNDNSPVCSPDVYTATLAEDTAAGTLVSWVLCTDNDVDAANNALTYSITAGNAEGKFEISTSTSGQVTVASGQSLDYETTTSYLLDVSVTDVSGVAVTAEVAVVVTGVNEFPPTFTATSYSADVNESLPIGTLVTFVAATDSDSGVDGTISYNITSGNELNHFILDSRSGFISTAAVLDRETTASYSLVVTADDGGTTLDTATVYITVNDINDNAPVCPTFYSVLVSDATLTNSIIETVVCTDADISPNIAMSYSIVTGNTNNDYSIDSTGDVRVVNTLDDAVTEFYTLEVWVTDGTQYTTVTYVYVQVQDASTTGLTFIPSNTYSFSVAENSAVGTAVGTVYAGVAGGQIAFSASPVVSTGGPVTFAISTATEHNGAQANTLFQITNSSSGAITILIPPDRETDDAVQFVVIASSAGPPALSAEATIFVDITDVNDNAPVFVSSFYSGECGTTSDFGQAIVTISATDADEGTSGTVTYGESAEYPELFELDTTTGNIRLVIDQTLATQTAYLMTMSGTDGGSPSLSSQTTVRVDAYDPYTTLVDIELAMTEDEFWTKKDAFLSEVTTILRTQYATARCGLAYITRKDVSVITTNRRRLLTTQGEVVARVYGVRNDNADTAAGINNNKEFFTDAEMLSTITGSGLTITDSITVQDYDDGTTTTTWIQYPASIALVVLSCIFFVLMVALIVALVIWCRRKRSKGKISKKDSVKDKPEKQQRWSSPLITAVPANNATKQPPPKRKADVVYIDRTEFDGEAVDEKTGREYYYNTKTGQRKWKDGLGNSTAVIVAAGRFKAPRNNPPKTTKTNRDSDVETIALDGTTFDGQARDPDTGRGYYFNSRTGDRKWKD